METVNTWSPLWAKCQSTGFQPGIFLNTYAAAEITQQLWNIIDPNNVNTNHNYLNLIHASI